MADQLQAGASWYVVSRPSPVLLPDGRVNYEIVGLHTDLQLAVTQAATIPGAAITLNVCLFINPAAVAPGPRLVPPPAA